MSSPVNFSKCDNLPYKIEIVYYCDVSSSSLRQQRLCYWTARTIQGHLTRYREEQMLRIEQYKNFMPKYKIPSRLHKKCACINENEVRKYIAFSPRFISRRSVIMNLFCVSHAWLTMHKLFTFIWLFTLWFLDIVGVRWLTKRRIHWNRMKWLCCSVKR